jgi:hypothetical protein
MYLPKSWFKPGLHGQQKWIHFFGSDKKDKKILNSPFVFQKKPGSVYRCSCKVGLNAGLPDFSRSKVPKRGKIYQITTKYTKWPQNIPNGLKIDQMVIKYTEILNSNTLQNLPKFGFLV